MFGWSQQARGESNTNRSSASTVVLVKESHWRSLTVLRQSNELYLCQRTPSDLPKYEIVYRSSKIYSLCRLEHFEVACTRFDCLQSISDVMFHPMNPNRRCSFITTAFQRVIDTSIEHPNWLDVHISAYNGFVDFFQKATLNQSQINAQTEPDLCTPLHLSILRGFVLTTRAILALRPNLDLLDSESSSILHYAALSKVEILDSVLQLSNMSKLSARNHKHWNPVELAAFKVEKSNNLQSMITFGLTARMLSLIAEPGKEITDCQREFLDKIDDQKKVTFTKSELDQMDLSGASKGGCPLHWALSGGVIERILKADFHIDTPNLRGETALCLAVKHSQFKIALCLLLNGADGNRANSTGDTPLHLATRQANLNLVRSLLVFDVEVNVCNGQGESARHIAATGSELEHRTIVQMFDSVGVVDCSFHEHSKCASGCHADRSNSQIFHSHLNDFPFNLSPKHRMLMNAHLTPNISSDPSHQTEHNTTGSLGVTRKKVMLVNFDGGGIKGIFTVQMMIELSKYLQNDFRNYFEWISGTSTGAMIAFSLAKGNSLAEMRKMYFQFKDEIMVGSRPYNATNLEALFQTEFDGSLRMGDLLTKYGKYVLLYATRIDCRPARLQTFRSYFYPGPSETVDSGENLRAWKAIRASTAAPTYFESYPPYIDGGFLANNPTIDSLTEFFRYQSAVRKYNQKKNHKPNRDKEEMESELQLVLSFGNGQIEPQHKDQSELYNRLYCLFNPSSVIRELSAASEMPSLKDQIQSIVTNCNEHIVVRSDSWCASLGIAFFRITPLLSKKICLNETDDTELVRGLWEVKVYAHHKEKELRLLAQVIDCMHETEREASPMQAN